MKFKILLSMALSLNFIYADALLLNEYNAVASDQQLKNNGYDTHFGDINGNGSSWIELVVAEDYLDIRGATLDIKKSGGVHVLSATFPDLLEFAYLRKGTILTISNEPTDLSYAPLKGNDWTINLNANDLNNKDGVFEISDRTMDISIVSVEDSLLMRHSGEVIKGWGIDNKEVFKLKKDPSASIEPTDPAYGDDYSNKQIISTFGSANQWIDSNDTTYTQNFSNLRDMTLENSINKMVLLNEYNAVASNKKLKKHGKDTFFGKIKGNGGSWLELVILKDKTDLRNSILKISDDNSIYKGRLPNIDILSRVRSGTIVTISEEPTDLSYNPFDSCGADWTLNINKDDLTTIEGSFFTSYNNLLVSMVSGSGDITIMPNSGEAITNSTIGKREIFKLKKDPSCSINPNDPTYGDDFNKKARSTFGSPNHWKKKKRQKLTTQNFDDLRVVALKENFRRHKSSLLLNEYNAVAPDKYLKNGGYDTYFGTVLGNGGSWLELVVTRDYLNLQNAKLTIKENCTEVFSAQIPSLLPLAYLRKGTVVTISDEATDMVYSPFAPHSPDWKLNINVNELTNQVGNFNSSHQDMIISILDSNGTDIILSQSGEGVWGDHTVDDREVYKLKDEPNKNITPYSSNYGNDDSSTEALSSFSNANQWYNGSVLKTQNFMLREDLDLNETGGIVLSNIVGLEALRDAESLQFVPINNSLWITDDDSHHVYEMDLTTHEIKSVFDDVDLGTFTNGDIQDHCANHLGACDIESVAYNQNSDTLYIFTGKAPGDPVIFKLTRADTNSTFTLSDYRKLNTIEYPATTFIGNDFIVASVKSLYTYDFNSNQADMNNTLYTTPTGKIVGLAYDNNSNILWVTTSNFELIKVNWSTKNTEAIYKMRDNGVYDPRGIELINNKLYILEGINNKAKADEAIAPIGHPLKNAIHIYQLP
jgi:uncharacterized protein YjiK